MQNYQWVNGKSTSSVTVDYSFTYRADNPGTYTIGEARITVDGKTYTTRPATFRYFLPTKQPKAPIKA